MSDNPVIIEALSMCTALDTETTSLDYREAEICEMGYAWRGEHRWEGLSELYGTNKPIPFAASNKNNISRRMLEGKPHITDDLENVRKLMENEKNEYNENFLLAHNAKYDSNVMRHALDYEYRRTIGHSVWLCTFRLAKQLIPKEELIEANGDGEGISYALNYLRFALDLGGGKWAKHYDSMTSHRADADAIICGLLFENLLERILKIDPSLDAHGLIMTAFEMSRATIDIKEFPFGKHKGTKLEDVPMSYYNWALGNMDCFNEDSMNYDEDLSESVAKVLEKKLL